MPLAATAGAPTETPFTPPEAITFVTVVNDRREFEQNLLASPVAASPVHEWIVIDNIGNRASEDICPLYCDACDRARNDLVFFFHQDVFIPAGWERQVFEALAELERSDRSWGVLGAVGVLEWGAAGPPLRGHWADPRQPESRCFGPLPSVVAALDELWLGIRKRRGVTFDRRLPGFHCYGIDLSLTAASLGLRSYAVDAWVAHKFKDSAGRRIISKYESAKIMRRDTAEFLASVQASYDYVGQKWAAARPMRSTSMIWKKVDG